MAEILNIKNGVVQGSSIGGVPFEVRLARYKTGRAFPNRKLRRYSGVAQHDTGNTNVGADAIAHAKFVQDVEDNKTQHASGYHFAVDDKRIIQIIPVTDVAWHAGDGSNGVGNNEYIAIELCINRDRDKTRAERNCQVLAASLLATMGGAYKKHQDFSGKHCPGTLLSRWGEFVGVVRGLKDSAMAAKKPSEEVAPAGRLYTVQVVAAKLKETALLWRDKLKEKGFSGYLLFDGQLWRVQAGAFRTKAMADALEQQLRLSGFGTYLTMKDDPRMVHVLAEDGKLTGVFPRFKPDFDSALKIVENVKGTALFEHGRTKSDLFDKVVQVGGIYPLQENYFVLGGQTKGDTDSLVDVWIRANQK